MKNNAKFESKQFRQLVLTSALAVAIATVACTKQPENKVQAANPAPAPVKQASLQTTTAASQQVESKAAEKISAKQPASKLLRYKSRDYGVAFDYPWQYQFASARTVSTNDGLKPKSDGFDGQITLARIDLPKGFFPDSNFDSG